MGCSLLSIVEIFYYILNGFFSYFSKSKSVEDIEWTKEQENYKSIQPLISKLECKLNQMDKNYKILSKSVEDLNKKFLKSKNLRM